MRRLQVSIVAMSLVLATLAVTAPPSVAASRRVDATRHQMLKATNGSRLSHGERRLGLNATMSAIARKHSLAMANQGYLFHTSNVNTYLAGVRWHIWGENVGYTQSGGVSALEQAFMQSPVHRENILNRSFRHVAIGTVESNGTLWVTVFFYG